MALVNYSIVANERQSNKTMGKQTFSSTARFSIQIETSSHFRASESGASLESMPRERERETQFDPFSTSAMPINAEKLLLFSLRHRHRAPLLLRCRHSTRDATIEAVLGSSVHFGSLCRVAVVFFFFIVRSKLDRQDEQSQRSWPRVENSMDDFLSRSSSLKTVPREHNCILRPACSATLRRRLN